MKAFYEAGLGAGAKDNGAPGHRPYHEHYFGAVSFPLPFIILSLLSMPG